MLVVIILISCIWLAICMTIFVITRPDLVVIVTLPATSIRKWINYNCHRRDDTIAEIYPCHNWPAAMKTDDCAFDCVFCLIYALSSSKILCCVVRVPTGKHCTAFVHIDWSFTNLFSILNRPTIGLMRKSQIIDCIEWFCWCFFASFVISLYWMILLMIVIELMFIIKYFIFSSLNILIKSKVFDPQKELNNITNVCTNYAEYDL